MTYLTLHDPYGKLHTDSRLTAPPSKATHMAWMPVSLMWAKPDHTSSTISQIVHGEPVALLESKGDYSRIVSLHDGYVGWVFTGELCPWPPSLPPQNPAGTESAAAGGAQALLEGTQTHASAPPTLGNATETAYQHLQCCVRQSWALRDPDVKSPPQMALSMGARLFGTGRTQGTYTETLTGWVPTHHLSTIAPHTMGQSLSSRLVHVAQQWMGVPYLWGGRSFSGIDCSGLVQVALLQLGYAAHRDSDLQFESLGRLLAEGETPQRGDLAFFPGHVGIFTDAEHILHANATRMCVSVDPLAAVISWVEKDLKGRTPPSDKPAYLGARRL